MESRNMNDSLMPTQEEIDRLHKRLDREAEAGGYHLNPDLPFTRDLVKGILINQNRYGYWNCPCRLAAGIKEDDLDIICPCDYGDADLLEWDACFCALYVSTPILKGEKKLQYVPERRPSEEARKTSREETRASTLSDFPYPVWRCRVCGYLCARENPPEICPVCKAQKDRFEKFINARK
jgi:ferredoxin-thioredoxin reductase catalytic subunit/rubredoxin